MYETHFGFHRQPFQCADLGRTFYASESIRRILPQLLHTLRSSLGIALVTAPRGAGRTTLLKHIQSLFDQEARTVILPGAALETSSDLQRALLLAALKHAGSPGQSLSADLSHAGRWNVIEQLRRTIEFWGPVIVLVDDCQLVPVSILNELRSFTEEEWNGRGLVRALVSAPMTFEEELARPVYGDFSRRIRCHAFLQPLTTVESVEFLRRHIEAVGAKLPHVFSADAVELLTQACEGLPRSLALLADETLLGASESGRKPADGATVRGALSRLQHLPYHWNMPAGSIHQDTESERSESGGSADVVEIAPVVTHSAASHSAIVYQSAGVIEFGAPSSGAAEFSSVVDFETDISAESMADRGDEEPPQVVPAREMPLPVSMSSAVPSDSDADPKVEAAGEERNEFGFMPTPSAQAMTEAPAVRSSPLLTIPETRTDVSSEFEVGHRFFATPADAEALDALELRQDSTGLLADHFSEYESAESFVDLADEAVSDTISSREESTSSLPASESAAFLTTEPRKVMYSQQPVQYFTGTSPEGAAAKTEETSTRTDAVSSFAPAGHSGGPLSLQEFSSRIPVFDRYTWLALGREVPAGRYSVTSSAVAGMTGRSSIVPVPESARTTQGLIPVVKSSDTEIDRWLSGETASSTEGEFTLTSSAITSQYESMESVDDPDDPASETGRSLVGASSPAERADDVSIGVEYYNSPATQDDLRSVMPASIQDRIAAVVEVATAQLPPSDVLTPVLSEENRSLIRDALRTSLRAEIEAAIDSGAMLPPPLPANASSDTWADGSLVFGTRQIVPPVASEASSVSSEIVAPAVPENVSSTDRLFTIPVDLHSIDWDLRSSIMEYPEVAPLAQSVDELRSEVSDFHATGRSGIETSTGERTRIDAESDDEQSLLAKARRRLYTAALAEIQQPGPLEGSKSRESNPSEPVEPLSATSESDVRFSTLFTRLRSMRAYRKDTVD